MSRLFLNSCAAVVLIGVGACATTNTDTSPGSRTKKGPERPITVPQIDVAESTDSSRKVTTADETLRGKAIAALDAENYIQAARLLDRALRIDARNAETYYQYARLRDAQDRYQEAIVFIQKGLSLAGGTSTETKLQQLRVIINSKVTD